MANQRQPSQRERSLYLVDYQCERLGITRARLFKEVASEFRELGLERHLPKPDTLEAYLKGRRPIPFESRVMTAPTWLDVCEWKFGEAYGSYFHPYFTLMFGPLRSSEHRRIQRRYVPTQWLAAAEHRGDRAEAEAYRSQNARIGRRAPAGSSRVDRLTQIHLAFLSLPEQARDGLMVRKGLSATWRRGWAEVGSEVAVAESLQGLDAVTVLAGLTLEAVVIGDEGRLTTARQALLANLPGSLGLQHFKRVREWVRRVTLVACGDASAWRYSAMAALAFGYPDSIAARVHHEYMLARSDQLVARQAGHQRG